MCLHDSLEVPFGIGVQSSLLDPSAQLLHCRHLRLQGASIGLRHSERVGIGNGAARRVYLPFCPSRRCPSYDGAERYCEGQKLLWRQKGNYHLARIRRVWYQFNSIPCRYGGSRRSGYVQWRVPVVWCGLDSSHTKVGLQLLVVSIIGRQLEVAAVAVDQWGMRGGDAEDRVVARGDAQAARGRDQVHTLTQLYLEGSSDRTNNNDAVGAPAHQYVSHGRQKINHCILAVHNPHVCHVTNV
mmetsp:Transcript_1095/g.1541  ORF Transcript_1095/g.1541 Transcript_1095/m.1541 type:complete len:241 (+) Transcript_1095:494-1216(+)